MKTRIIILFLFPILTLWGQTLPVPYNLDFEIGEKGKLPKGWFVPSYAENLGYKAYLTDEEPHNGKFCLELFREGEFKEGVYGSVMQSIDAKPYQGKLIRFRAYIRAEIHSSRGSAHIWVRERFSNEEEAGFFEYLPNSPCVLREWEVREIVGRISKNAVTINFGLLLFGNGKVWIDSASFEIVQENENLENNKQLTKYQINELVDFAKVYGIARYFCPLSDIVSNWDCFALKSIEYILNHPDISIEKKIRNIFSIFLSNNNTQSYDSLGYLFWIHNGFPSDKPHPFFGSTKANLLSSLRKSPGIVQQVVNVEKYQSRNAKFSVYFKGKLLSNSSKVILAVRYDDKNNKQVSYDVKEINESSDDWKKIELDTKIPMNASFANPAIILVGEGEIYCDDAFFQVEDSNENLLKNSSFEISRDSLLVYNWKLLDISSQSGYFAFVKTKSIKTGSKVLQLFSDTETRIQTPEIGQKTFIKLSNDTLIEIPLILPRSFIDKHTNNPIETDECNFNLNNKHSQIAILIIFWNFIQHFNTYVKTDVDFDEWLAKSLEKLNFVSSTYQFYLLLCNLTNQIEDNVARIIHKDFINEKTFPFLWKYINGKVYLTALAESLNKVEIADEVIEINSKPTKNFVDSISEAISFNSPEWKYLKTLAFIRNNLPDDSLVLTLKKKNGKIYTTTFTKNISSFDLVENRPNKFQILDKNIAYFDLTRISEKELKDILDTIPKYPFFIFDLRGISLVGEQFLALFTDKTITNKTWKLPVFAFPNKKNISYQVISTKIIGNSYFTPKEVLFLIDKRTIGIAEVIADIAKTNKIGKLVGEQTGGNPMEMVSYQLPGGFTFYFGTFDVFGNFSNPLYKEGVQPNIPVFEKIEPELLTQDQTLQKALFIISQKNN